MALTGERPPSRSYRQYCAVARGLDVVGERWTLLIVRDLLIGPKRYKDLLTGLPGIGTNLLATRLRDLEEQGLVGRRVLPPPAGSTVYELTQVGQALEPVVTALGRWGHRFLGARREGEFLSANACSRPPRNVRAPRRQSGVCRPRRGRPLYHERGAAGCPGRRPDRRRQHAGRAPAGGAFA
jgi:DNA-binding HxlR family transcriptional regulator